MIKKTIYLKTVERVKDFVNAVNQIECTTDLYSNDNHYIVDAKSIMGIFSIDICKPLTLVIQDDNLNNEKKYDEILWRFTKDV